MTEDHDETSESVLVSTTTKRPSVLEQEEITENAMKRARMESNATTTTDVDARTMPRKRWRTHQMAEDYISMVGNLMYPGGKQGAFGFDPRTGSFPMERSTTLGHLTSPLRRPSILETWNPLEISLFEACMAKYGKDFYKASKYLGHTKTTKDVIAFYYIWKKTKHYERWKTEYVVDYSGDSGDEDNAATVKSSRK